MEHAVEWGMSMRTAPETAVPAAVSLAGRPAMPRQPGAGVLAGVRASTRATHEALDALLPQGLRNLHDYRRYLAAMLPLAEWLARGWQSRWPAHLACWHDPVRLEALRHDAACLDIAEVPANDALPATPAAWLGGCYVIEGSALGARLLARDVAGLAGQEPAVADARRFLSHVTADPVRWRGFARLLDRLPPEQGADAVAGAITGFAIVHARLSATGAPA